jgi:hypothetical protein
MASVQVKCFATISTATQTPNVAAIAAILNMVPITTDLNDDRACDGDAGFLPFCFFVAIADPVESDPST